MGSTMIFLRRCFGAGQSRVTRFASPLLRIRLVAAMAMLAFTAPLTVLAQSTSATISGTITDESGAVIQGAQILLRNQATSTEQSTVSGDAGNFTIINIPPGVYFIRVGKTGFAAVEQTHLTLLVNQTAAITFRLPIGKTQQTITASPGVLTVDSSTAELAPSSLVNPSPIFRSTGAISRSC